MRDRLDARRFEIALEQANAGNVTALRELGAMIDRNDRMVIESKLGKSDGDDDQQSQSRDKLGKKVAAEQRAHAADADLTAELESEASQNARH